MNIYTVNVYVLEDLCTYINKADVDEKIYSKLVKNMAYIDMNDILKYIGSVKDIKYSKNVEKFIPYTK